MADSKKSIVLSPLTKNDPNKKRRFSIASAIGRSMDSSGSMLDINSSSHKNVAPTSPEDHYTMGLSNG